MAQFELLLPKMGESVAEATIVKWLKNPGDQVNEDEAIAEIATDKVDSEVPSPVAGKLLKILVNQDDVAQIGAAIAIIETEGSNDPINEEVEQVPVEQEFNSDIETLPGIEELQQHTSNSSSVQTEPKGIRFYSPLVKSIAVEEGLSQQELDSIPGSGADGRVTKQDILNYVNSREAKPVAAQRDVVEPAKPAAETINIPEIGFESPKPLKNHLQPVTLSAGDEIIEMTRMRRLISEHMVMSRDTSVHVTSFVEADVTNLVKWRDKIKSAFEKREGEKITFTPIFVQAATRAIKDFPLINVSVNGNQIIKKRDINIGLAAALPSGDLIVPVIKNAGQLNLVGLTKAVNDLANRARANKLLPDEVKDGTFTITNIGSFGNIMGTPIINQPQVAILAIGAIQKKPAVLETEHGDVIAIRHKMFLSMSYDHRVVDGALGGMFLKRVADYLEGWDINAEI